MNDTLTNTLLSQLINIKDIIRQLQSCNNITQKLDILNHLSTVHDFASSNPTLYETIDRLESESSYAIKCLIALDQAPIIFHEWETTPHIDQSLENLTKILKQVEQFYLPIGGILGYHCTVIELIINLETPQSDPLTSTIHFSKPEGLDISSPSPLSKMAVRWGIENLPYVGEIYAAGGAGDRLNLIDPDTGEALPAAQLRFIGRSLLELMVRDLEAREYVYFKCFNKQLLTPIGILTSEEKNNDFHIRQICQSVNWFKRPRDSFCLFAQPLVPMITRTGIWCSSAPFELKLKPGGHGAIWKLAQDNHVFQWFRHHQRNYVQVRQINNPAAGTDSGLFVLNGWGIHNNKAFGFASCDRRLNASEGMNVLIETQQQEGFDYSISNLEYTEFSKNGILDIPVTPGSNYSAFPANTNILFGKIDEIETALQKLPIPGMIINMKTKVTTRDKEGHLIAIEAGRLESTMQNIADAMTDHFLSPIEKNQQGQLKTFITYNERKKTISVAKKEYVQGQSLCETPPGALYEILHNYHSLLENECHFKLPSIPSEAEFIEKGPSFFVLFHPAIGPLYCIISQKIQNGRLGYGSEWQMEAAEVYVNNLDVEGSCLVYADAVLGHLNEEECLVYSNQQGKCVLKDVKIRNQGIDRRANNEYWKNLITRHEAFKVILRGNGEFYAKDVIFSGNFDIEVPNGHRMVVTTKGGEISFELDKIDSPTWFWKYTFDKDNDILLTQTQ